jgi:6-pyruvoyltetrahydropterin/6-carboxytetrahydropterin synthase
MFELRLRGEIAAAHFLRGYPGKCRDLHGHTWKVEVFLLRGDLDGLGMVRDFADLKKGFREFLDRFDHKCLNDLEYFQAVNPTAENIAKYIFESYAPAVAPLTLSKVSVWESGSAGASYFL